MTNSSISADRGGSRVRRPRLERLREQLAERDWVILRLLRKHGYLTTKQVRDFVFVGHASPASASRSCRRVLERLARDGLIQALPRRQGGLLAGSAPATWQLRTAGARLLTPDTGASFRSRVPSLHHLQHTLALADVHLVVRDYATTHELAVDVAVEHEARRTFTGTGGEPLLLRPDLSVALHGSDNEGAFVDYWFVEVDLGTESVPTLVRKCERYLAYHASGVEQERLGVFPRVLWLMHGDNDTATRRSGQLEMALQRRSSGSHNGVNLFRVTIIDGLGAALGGAS